MMVAEAIVVPSSREITALTDVGLASCKDGQTSEINSVSGLGVSVVGEGTSGGRSEKRGKPCLDFSAQKQLVKGIRVLAQVVLKQTANTNPLFGAGTRTMSMVFMLKRAPVKMAQKAFHVPLPYPLFAGRPAEAQFNKVSGKRFLCVHFGWCSMEEDRLVKNAVAVIDSVWSRLEGRLVREVVVRELGGLALPVWNCHASQRWNRRSLLLPSKRGTIEYSMLPPAGPVVKKVRK